MMTFNEYMKWNGSFTREEEEKAFKNERTMLNTLTEEEKDEYFNLCKKHVYAYVDFGKAEERRTGRALYDFCKAHNFSIEEAMIVY